MNDLLLGETVIRLSRGPIHKFVEQVQILEIKDNKFRCVQYPEEWFYVESGYLSNPKGTKYLIEIIRFKCRELGY